MLLNPLAKNLNKISILNRTKKTIDRIALNSFNYVFRYNLYEKAYENTLNDRYERETNAALKDLKQIHDYHKSFVDRSWSVLKVKKI